MIRHKKCFALLVLFLVLVSELAVFEFVPSVKAQEPQQRVFGNPSLPDWKNITVTVAGDGKSFTLDNADNLSWVFPNMGYAKDKYPSIYQNGVQIVKDELWMLQVYDGSWKDIGSSVNVFYEQVTSYNVRVVQSYISKNGDYNVTWNFYGGYRPKISFAADIKVAGTYRVDWRTYVYKDYAENMTNYVRFWNSGEEAVVFDYSDVYEAFGNITSVEGIDGWTKGKRFDLIFNVGSLPIGVFSLDPNFGYETIGASATYLAYSGAEYIQGTAFTCPENGTAQSITMALKRAAAGSDKVICGIYKASDKSFVGKTEEKTVSMTTSFQWFTFNFPDPKPSLTAGTSYILVARADYTSQIIYQAYDTGATSYYSTATYSTTFPDPWSPTTWSNVKISTYCTYTTGGAQEYSRSVTQTLPVSPIVTRTGNFQRSLTQIFQFLGAPTKTLTLVRQVTETGSLQATVARLQISMRTVPQAVSLILSTTWQLSVLRQPFQAVTLETLANRFATLPRTASQTVSVLVTSLRTLNLPRALSETVNIQAFSSTMRTFSRLQLQSISLIPSTIRTLSAQRQAFQSFSISSLTSRLASLARTQTQQFTLALNIIRTQTFARLVSATITSQASTIRWQQLLRQANIPFQIISTVIGEKAGFYERLITQTFLMLPSTARSIVGSRQAAQQFLLLTFTSRSAQPTRLITGSIETLADALRTIQTARIAPLNVILAFQGTRATQFTRVSPQSLIIETLADKLLYASRTVTSQFTILLSVTSQKTTFGILRSVDLSIIVHAIAQRTHVSMTRTANALFQAIISISRLHYPAGIPSYIISGPISTPNFEISIESFSFGMNTVANQLTTKTIIKFQPLDAFNGNVTLHYWISDYTGTTQLAYQNKTIFMQMTDRDPTLSTLTLNTPIFWTCITNDHLIWHLNAEYNGITTGEIRILFTPIPWLTQIKPFSIYFLIVAILLACYWIFFKSD